MVTRDKRLKIKEFYIEEYKNQKISISFESNRSQFMFLVGNNGSGKSTILEALVFILTNLASKKYAWALNDTKFYFHYELGNEDIVIDNRSNTTWIHRNGKSFVFFSVGESQNYMDEEGLLPEGVTVLYSGENNRFKGIKCAEKRLFTEHPIVAYGGRKNDLSILLACLGHCGQFKEDLVNLCDIYSITEICIYKTKRRSNIDDLEKFAINTKDYLLDKIPNYLDVVQEGYDEKLNHFSANVSYSFKINISQADIDTWMLYNVLDYVRDSEIKIHTLYINGQGLLLNDESLSQGQRQWVNVMGMLFVMNHTKCVCVMDDPDAYMNPRWKYGFKEVLEKHLPENSSDIIIATHDPLMINGVNKENVVVISRNEKTIQSMAISEDLIGKDANGILTGECFGLRSTYDVATIENFQKRQSLYIKALNGNISSDEKEELRRLTKELDGFQIGFSHTDFVYMDFYKEYIKSEYYGKEVYSPEEIVKKQECIKDIIANMHEDEE